MTNWNGPAIGVVLIKLVELAARAERVRVAAQARSNARVLALLTKRPAP